MSFRLRNKTPPEMSLADAHVGEHPMTEDELGLCRIPSWMSNRPRGLADGKRDHHRGPLARRALSDEDPAAVIFLHHAARERKPESPAATLGGVARLEDTPLLARRHALP